ncbi:MAG: GNAT family N-acetyltransferase [Candidatus Roizmanbacteria bacterium]|nr:MAG: GNAT family N-acetyltransferase [Candidatus Roizmanbacteria bacterium]
MNITLVPIGLQEKEHLNNLLIKYKKELTGNLGRYKYLDSYFEEKDRYPFFIKVDGNVAGFVLVNNYSIVAKGAKSIGEFFVEQKYRKQGVGKEAAKKVFDLFPGKWEIRQLHSNPQGQIFWRKVIKEYIDDNYQEVMLNNEKWHGTAQIFKT